MKASARSAFLKFIPRLIAFSMLIIALLEPSFGNFDSYTRTKVSNRIVYFLVDVSKSMDAKDIAPSRLEKAKFEIKKIVNYFPNDRFGIIAFASDAVLHTALTTDNENFKTMIQTLNTDFVSETGTNLEAALKLSLEKINNSKFQNETSFTIIIYTDGEDFGDINEKTLNDLKRKRINLILAGIGTKKGTTIETKEGKPMKNKNDIIIKTKLESEYLKTIVTKANGKYFEYNNINSPFADIIDNIENQFGIEGQQSLDASNPGNKFHYPLLIAIFIICLDLLITVRIFNF